jgi:hypothetical protein
MSRHLPHGLSGERYALGASVLSIRSLQCGRERIKPFAKHVKLVQPRLDCEPEETNLVNARARKWKPTGIQLHVPKPFVAVVDFDEAIRESIKEDVIAAPEWRRCHGSLPCSEIELYFAIVHTLQEQRNMDVE